MTDATASRYFVYRLIPPRPTFERDMNEQEAAIMAEHAGYWEMLIRKGTAVLFGPVSDPAGSWGLAVVEAPNEQEVDRLGHEDPAVTSGTATFEVCPMPVAMVRD